MRSASASSSRSAGAGAPSRGAAGIRRSPRISRSSRARRSNDLGRPDEALERVDAALRISPGRGDALHEKGVALFNLSRFADAKVVLSKTLAIQPDDAYTHQMLGLVLEELGETKAGEAELHRALELAPAELSAPVMITTDRVPEGDRCGPRDAARRAARRR